VGTFSRIIAERTVKKLTEEQITDEVFGWFLDEPLDLQREFANSSKEALIDYHSTLGRNIRNRFELWQDEWAPQIEDGVDVSPLHPDAISMRIIEAVWDRSRRRVVSEG
jgi:predicted unusual protein kinase regulating ubiquinone biosynthesis (AarF/ABC1/UbiB family)